MKAIFEKTIIARSNDAVLIEGNYYFPPDSVEWEFLKETNTTSVCPWKGKAHFFSVVVDGKESRDAAWQYSEPGEKAEHIRDFVAFWRGVSIVD